MADFDDYEEYDKLDHTCPNCGVSYDMIDYEFQICHYCKFNNNSKEEQDGND